MIRTKIVCTIGPASEDEETIRAMIRAGMDVARINFSHGTPEEHKRRIETIRKVAGEEDAVVAIICDLQGPKLRIGEVADEPRHLEPGEHITLTLRDVPGTDGEIHLPHPEIVEAAEVGDRMLLDDGKIELRVVRRTKTDLVCEVVVGGELKSRKGISVPGMKLNLSALTERDKEFALCALDYGTDYLALSFVRTADDVLELRKLVESHDGDAAIIAKIEKPEALDNFDAILEVSDAIMIARGDLGVEIPAEEVPLRQKEIIAKCNHAAKPVITATQMLSSMISNPRPTRAEASDVANAILDGTDAVMLSGETAIGEYPVESVQMMARIAHITEEAMPYRPHFDIGNASPSITPHVVTKAISAATTEVAHAVGARLIVTTTWSGYTARQVARERPHIPILGVTPNGSTYHRLALVWGVMPMLVREFADTDAMIETVVEAAEKANLVKPGDLLVITAGVPVGGGGRTNFLKVHRVRERA